MIGCDKAFKVEVDPITAAVCFKGDDYALLKKYCLGPKPLDPLTPLPGDFNEVECSQVFFDFSCNGDPTQVLGILTSDGKP